MIQNIILYTQPSFFKLVENCKKYSFQPYDHEKTAQVQELFERFGMKKSGIDIRVNLPLNIHTRYELMLGMIGIDFDQQKVYRIAIHREWFSQTAAFSFYEEEYRVKCDSNKLASELCDELIVLMKDKDKNATRIEFISDQLG